MYNRFLHIHDGLRWLILVVFVITLVKYLAGWLGSQPWKKMDNMLGLVLTSLMDLQLIVGVILYFFLSPVTRLAMSDLRGAMKDPDLRFYAIEHLVMMLVAVVLVHIGRAKSKKAVTDSGKFKTGTIYLLIAFVVILMAIPWNRL
ncbi:MAG: hypothetical protein ACM3P1_05600 [Candidatus Saccharibacteria bacterium]